MEGPSNSGGPSEILGVGGVPLRRATSKKGVGGVTPGVNSGGREGQLPTNYKILLDNKIIDRMSIYVIWWGKIDERNGYSSQV